MKRQLDPLFIQNIWIQNYESTPFFHAKLEDAFNFEFTSTIDCVSGYQCSNGPCISNSSVCDGWNDCSDGADEAGCGKYQLHFCIVLYYFVHSTSTSTIH